tara:strand:+ start:410 stop:676 length:267 start_codon:yes stop_codon:yes gene_type:complete
MEMILNFLSTIFATYGEVFPSWAVQVFAVMGSLRFFLKPITSLADAYVAFTENKEDDLVLEKAKNSKIYTSIAFILDWAASVRFPKKK